MSGSKRDNAQLVIGGEPRIDFLPPESKVRKENRRKRRALVALVIMVVVVCVLGYYSATAVALQSQVQLEQEQARTKDLLSRQQEFAEARSADTELRIAKNARLVGSATEIIWSDYVDELAQTLPEGAVIDTITVDSQSALELTPEVSGLLQEPHVASLFITIKTPSLSASDAVLKNLRDLSAFADVTATTIELEESIYSMTIVLNVNSDAFERRFFEQAPAADDSSEG